MLEFFLILGPLKGGEAQGPEAPKTNQLETSMKPIFLPSFIKFRLTVLFLSSAKKLTTYTHTYRHFLKTRFSDSGGPKTCKKHIFSKSIFYTNTVLSLCYTFSIDRRVKTCLNKMFCQTWNSPVRLLYLPLIFLMVEKIYWWLRLVKW